MSYLLIRANGFSAMLATNLTLSTSFLRPRETSSGLVRSPRWATTRCGTSSSTWRMRAATVISTAPAAGERPGPHERLVC